MFLVNQIDSSRPAISEMVERRRLSALDLGCRGQRENRSFIKRSLLKDRVVKYRIHCGGSGCDASLCVPSVCEISPSPIY